jgi:hypothetical protein
LQVGFRARTILDPVAVVYRNGCAATIDPALNCILSSFP